MKKIEPIVAAIALSVLGSFLALAQQPAQSPPQPMSFFITSAGSGHGANLGGLAGADRICQTLAVAVGSTKTWHAYMSTQGPNAVNARDRIGTGPWYNAKGVLAKHPILQPCAAISVGIIDGTPMLDLEYTEDVRAEVDMNVVMTGGGRFVEVQGTAEGMAFTRGELDTLLGLAEGGIKELTGMQAAVLDEAPPRR